MLFALVKFRFVSWGIGYAQGTPTYFEVRPRYAQHVHFNSRTEIFNDYNFLSIDSIDVLLLHSSSIEHKLSIPQSFTTWVDGWRVGEFFGTHKDLGYIPCYEIAEVMF